MARATPERPAYDLSAFAAALREGISSSGRPLAATMPRYRIEDGALSALADHLAALPRLQRRGITSDRIVLGFAIPPDNPALAEAYAQELSRALAAGPPAHDRQPTVVQLSGSRDDILGRAGRNVAAVIGLVPSSTLHHTDVLDRGIRVLAPLYPADGTEDRGLFRALSADWSTILAALRQRLEPAPGPVAVINDTATAAVHPGLHLIIGSTFGAGSPLIAETMSDGSLVGEGSVVLLGQDSEAVRTALAAVAPIARLYVLGNLVGLLKTSGQDWTRPPVLVVPAPALVRASLRIHSTPLQVHARATAATIDQALLLADRDLTRATLLSSFDQIDSGPLGTDSSSAGLTGSREVVLVPLASVGFLN